MNECATTYSKPTVSELGSAVEVICGTIIKGPIGLLESFHWRIAPAYDLDD